MSSTGDSTIMVFVVGLSGSLNREAFLAGQGIQRGIFDTGGGREAGARRSTRGNGGPRGEAEFGSRKDGEALAFARGGALLFNRPEAREGRRSLPAHSRRGARDRRGNEESRGCLHPDKMAK